MENAHWEWSNDKNMEVCRFPLQTNVLLFFDGEWFGGISKPTYSVVVYFRDGVVAIVWRSSRTRAIVQAHQFIVHIKPNLYKYNTPGY